MVISVGFFLHVHTSSVLMCAHLKKIFGRIDFGQEKKALILLVKIASLVCKLALTGYRFKGHKMLLDWAHPQWIKKALFPIPYSYGNETLILLLREQREIKGEQIQWWSEPVRQTCHYEAVLFDPHSAAPYLWHPYLCGCHTSPPPPTLPVPSDSSRRGGRGCAEGERVHVCVCVSCRHFLANKLASWLLVRSSTKLETKPSF